MKSISVQPVTSTASQFKRRPSLVKEVKDQAAHSWHRSQIGLRSEYSVERFLAFKEYYERTSLCRAVAVCVLTPIPSLTLAVVIDCIPLEPPSAGWRANYALWIRLFVTMAAISRGLVAQIKENTLEGTMSSAGAVKVALGTACTYVIVSITVASLWHFPIPFGMVLMVSPYVWIFSFFTIVVIGPRVLFRSSVLQQQIKAQLLIVVAQGIVAVAYPLFSAIFNRLAGWQQTVFVVIMPLIKFFTKQLIANAAQSLHECIGPVVVFSVDVYNVFYLAICMQSSTSIATTLVMIASDSFHVVMALRSIFKQTSGVQEATTDYLRDLPGMIRRVLEAEDKFHLRARQIRVSAPFPLPLSNENKELIHEFKKIQQYREVGKSEDPRISFQTTHKVESDEKISYSWQSSVPTISLLKQHQVAPMSTTQLLQAKGVLLSQIAWKTVQKLPSFVTSNSNGALISSFAKEVSSLKTMEKTVQDGLQTLFHSEYVLMAEYIEFILPMLYALYLAAIYQLPVAAYYPHTENMTTGKLESTVGSIVTFSAVEFVGFGALLVLLRRKFGFSPLYQLAFVLETHARTLQGYLFVWTPFILHLTLAHYGVDFKAVFS